MNIASWEYAPNGEIPADQCLPEGLSRIAMRVEYDGSGYSGWQRQSHCNSIQETLEKALSKVANEPIEVICAGRTDSGVHANSQYVHFDTRAMRSDRNWLLGTNSSLPQDIALSWVGQVPGQFHARFSALSRTYRYIIYNKGHSPAILHAGLTWYRQPLDDKKMHRAAQFLLGEQDFSSFRAAGCVSKSPMRQVQGVAVARVADYVVLEITANAFLQHMVRNIVGLLLEIGSSDLEPIYLKEVLAARDRKKSAPTAKPNGLYLVDVEYPPEFPMPREDRGPSFLRAVLLSDGIQT